MSARCVPRRLVWALCPALARAPFPAGPAAGRVGAPGQPPTACFVRRVWNVLGRGARLPGEMLVPSPSCPCWLPRLRSAGSQPVPARPSGCSQRWQPGALHLGVGGSPGRGAEGLDVLRAGSQHSLPQLPLVTNSFAYDRNGGPVTLVLRPRGLLGRMF